MLNCERCQSHGALKQRFELYHSVLKEQDVMTCSFHPYFMIPSYLDIDFSDRITAGRKKGTQLSEEKLIAVSDEIQLC